MTVLTNWLVRFLGLHQPKPKPTISIEHQAVIDMRIAHHKTKNGEFYVFVWMAGQEPELFMQVGKYAASPDHPGFDWIDAAMVAESVERKQ